MDSSEVLLVSNAKQGDNRSFKALFGLYGDRVYTFLLNLIGNREDAEDLLQETFLTAYGRLHTLTEDRAFSRWLYAIARNLAVNFIRQEKKHSLEYLDDYEDRDRLLAGLETQNPEELFQQEEFLSIVQRILEEIPEGPRVAFALVSIEGMTYREASEMLGCTEGNLRLRIYRARKAIQQKLRSYL